MSNDPFAIDHIGNTPLRKTEHAARDAELLAQRAAFVRQETVRDLMSVGKTSMARDAVGGDADDGGPCGHEVVARVTKAANLGGTNRRVVLGIEKEDDRPLGERFAEDER